MTLSVLHSPMFTMTVSLTGAFLFCFVSLGHSYPMIRGKAPGTNPLTHGGHKDNVTGLADRCTDDGFGAITLDDNGVMHFFRGDYVWTGFHGSAQYINETWEGLTAPVDAAIRISNKKQPLQHQRTYIFKASSVWSFFDGRLVDGFPRLISQEFPGIPDNLDAAVECHEGECKTDSVIFFKGDTVYVYSPLEVPQVKQRQWLGLCPCSAAVRWMERYYCFKGTNFTRFDPVSGHRLSNRSLDTRDYFMNCPGRGHRHVAQQNATLMAITNRCSNQTFRAFSSDDKGRTYAFRGGWYFRLDSRVDGWHPWPVSHAWRNLQGEVDAAFSWENKMYIIQGSQVSIYLSDQVYTPVQGYPKSLQEELGVTKVDAAFTCPHSSKLYVIKGNMIHEIDLKQSPRVPGLGRPIAQSHVDSAMCNVNGLYLFYGPIFYQYKNVEQLVASTELPKPGNLTANFFEC